ncbi:H2A super protein [Saitoella coloradoensis]
MAASKAYKTKFPVARIKKIMQADEDVGKVAQITPIVISRALELFMQQIILASTEKTRERGAKRVTVGHMKQAVMETEMFDFLEDIVGRIGDGGGEGSPKEEE